MGTSLANAKVILADEVIPHTSVRLEDGVIDAIGDYGKPNDSIVNVNGDVLMPGMMDLHCDDLEKDIEPRRNVHFPIEFALQQNDQRNAMAGVTTPFHATSFAGEELGIRCNRTAAEVVRGVIAARSESMVDHRLHLRYEYAHPEALQIVLDLIAEGGIDLVSLMTHGPGLKQFSGNVSYESYMAANYDRTEAEVLKLAAEKDSHRPTALQRCYQIAEVCRRREILLASHDDESRNVVRQMASLGVGLSEFPITLEAAQAARPSGVATMFGAPNILRGRSQSGSIKALDAVEHNVIDALCSDYHPGTLLPAIFRIPELTDWSLPEAVRLVTANPASAAGLSDRGVIEVGKRADVLRVHLVNGYPRVGGVWVAGRSVLMRSADTHELMAAN